MNQIKFTEKNVPRSSLTLAKEFQSPSFSRLTCATSTQVMGKRAFHFDQKKQSCQIFEVKGQLNFVEDVIPNEEYIAIKIDG